MIKKRFHLGTVYGIPFTVTALWVLAFSLGTYTLSSASLLTEYLSLTTILGLPALPNPLFTGTLPGILFAIAVTGSIYASILLHELGHAYGATRHDIRVDEITLWMLGGAAHIAGQPDTARSEFDLTIAGPLVSCIIGISMLTVTYLVAPLHIPVLTAYCFIIALLNLGMLLLNLIPAFPLDGGRLLRSVLTATSDYRTATKYATATGKAFAIVFILAAVFTGELFGIILGGFVFLSARSENKHVQRSNFPYLPSFNPTTGTIDELAGNTFVFKTTVTEPHADAETLVEKHGGHVALNLNDNVDYIVVPEDDMNMYTAISRRFNAQPVPDTLLGTELAKLERETEPRSGPRPEYLRPDQD